MSENSQISLRLSCQEYRLPRHSSALDQSFWPETQPKASFRRSAITHDGLLGRDVEEFVVEHSHLCVVEHAKVLDIALPFVASG